ncbi:PAS domain-containing protein (plasmid) [Halarchaeum sp. CBA1220]|uniref:sensor histidine kinase n=1 Tax=Halarchaeum sp. CBA1220 TaxID=1853682 RepID=UPI001314859B|nr:HAMP domain-containing sensor histidine kinase [Halarchaeum sp. CBA1220]QLC34850.1 PAS domain-containing protein [Halarchaeum sp. CBA1220]
MTSSLRRRVAVLVVACLGLVLLGPPVFDILDDWLRPPFKPLWTTLIENGIGVVLAGTLLAGSLWLYRQDWEDEYVSSAAIWVLVVVVGHALVMGWILYVQVVLQNDIKPYIIAMDSIVLSADVALAVGIYNARSKRTRDTLERERDRLAALFENSDDPIATVRLSDGTVETANEAFRARFGDDAAPILDAAPRPIPDGGTAVRAVSDETVEYEWGGRDGEHDYLVSVTPIHEEDGRSRRAHVRVADITEQKALAREQEARERLEHLHRVASDLASADDERDAFDRTLNALRATVDFDAACIVVDGEVVASRGATAVVDRDGIERVQPGAVPTDGGALTRTTEDGRRTLTVPIGDDAVLQAALDHGSFRESQVTAAELLGTHLRETRRRLAREDRLRDQRERLELLNRTFRHDLLNDVNVISARATLLEEFVDSGGERYLETIGERADDMDERIQTMRSLMQAVEGDDHDLAPVPLAETVKGEVDQARDAHPSAAFEVETPLPSLTVRADELLGDVFENLLANAVEHNDADAPHVRVSAEREGDDVVVTVADNGSGVPPERRDEIFELGEKGEESGGTGVGLNICERVVASYGGELDVGDADLGGAAFTVRLPVAT